MRKYKLGKRPANRHVHRLWLSKYVNRSVITLPTTEPRNFAQQLLAAGQQFHMYANGPDPTAPAAVASGVGDCFWAALAEKLRWDAYTVGEQINFTTMNVLNAYASTGFDINNPQATDNGTDALQGFQYMQQTGMQDADGKYHKIAAFVWVNPLDWEEVMLAHNLFDGLMIGVTFPASWEDADVWDSDLTNIEGGHEIPGYSNLNVVNDGVEIATWGMSKILTKKAIASNCDELAVMISPDLFGPTGMTIEGFDAEQLQHDSGYVSAPQPPNA